MKKDKKRRILIFSTAYLPLVGGAEIAIADITKKLTDYRFDLVCARLQRHLPKKETLGRVRVYRLGWGTKIDKYWLPLAGFWRGQKLLSQKKYAGLWSVIASYNSFAALFLKWLHPRLPFLLTLQEGDSIEQIKRKTRFFRVLFRQIFKRADYVQVISRYLGDLAVAMGTRAKISVVPNPVDMAKFSFAPAAKTQWRQKIRKNLDLNNSDIVVVSASRLVPKNRMGDLISALNWVPLVKLLLLGDGPQKAELQAQAKSQGVEHRVVFWGTVDHEKIPEFLAAADIFCRPSASEGLGTAFLEAMAAGLPVIATPVGGIVDFISDYETGILTEPQNPRMLAAKIEQLVEKEDLRQRLAAAGRRLVCVHYSQEIIAGKMRSIFQRVFL